LPALSQANSRAGASPAKHGNRRGCATIFRHVERSRDIPLQNVKQFRDLIRSLPVRSACGLPVHVAASRAAQFSSPLAMTETTISLPLRPSAHFAARKSSRL
jgi:hypothetical protein